RPPPAVTRTAAQGATAPPATAAAGTGPAHAQPGLASGVGVTVQQAPPHSLATHFYPQNDAHPNVRQPAPMGAAASAMPSFLTGSALHFLAQALACLAASLPP